MKYLGIAALCLVTLHQAHADITIGLAGPLTGPNVQLASLAAGGAQQAVDDINAKGGVRGEKLVLQSYDDACDPKQAMMVANRYVSSGVKFVVGHVCPDASLAAAKIYNAAHIVMISALTTDPALTDQGYANVFRSCERTDMQGVVQANYVMRNFRASYLAVLHDNTASSRAQANMFKKTLNAGNFRESLFDSYKPGETDYSPLIAKLRQYNIQLLVISGASADVARIARELKQQQLPIQIMGVDSLATDAFWQSAGEAGENVLMTAPPDMHAIPAAQPVLAELQKSTNDASAYALYGYTAVQVLAQGIKQAGYPDPFKVGAIMHKTNFDTALGSVSFDDNGDMNGPDYIMYRWHDGKYTPAN